MKELDNQEDTLKEEGKLEEAEEPVKKKFALGNKLKQI